MGYRTYRRHRLHLRAERVVDWFSHTRIQIEVPRIIVHKADQPNIITNFLDADRMAGKDGAEVTLFVPLGIKGSRLRFRPVQK